MATKLDIPAHWIESSFRGSGLWPLNPQAVLSKLTIMVRPPSPSLPTTHWQSKTPSNAHEIEQQISLIHDKFVHQNSSPTSVQCRTVTSKGLPAAWGIRSILLSNKLPALQEVVKSVQSRRTRQEKAHRVPAALTTDGRLTMQSAASEANGLMNQPSGTPRQKPRCSRCRMGGHTVRSGTADSTLPNAPDCPVLL